MERSGDWLRQAERDLAHARTSAEAGDHEWACFASHQAAEKALKGLHQALGGEGWGHSVASLLTGVRQKLQVEDELVTCGLSLDKLYIPTRYPNGFDVGAPADYYTEEDSRGAIERAERIVAFCRRGIP